MDDKALDELMAKQEVQSVAQKQASLDDTAKARLDRLFDQPKGETAHGLTVGDPVPLTALNEADPIPAADRIRAFEDAEFGPDAVRINDNIERGSGSPYAAMSPEKKRQYAALENLLVAERRLADAHAALIDADVNHDAALAAAEPAADAE